MSVTGISLEVGYNSLGTFTRRFTELVGISPRRFRQLAQAGARTVLDQLKGCFDPPANRKAGGIHGRVTAPQEFSGVIFVGLFKTAIPQSRPLACSLMTAPGPFRLPEFPRGRYFLATTALRWSLDPMDYLLYDKALRGGTRGQLLQIRDGAVKGRTDLDLRAPEAVDPPILMTLPLLLTERRRSLERRAAETSSQAALG